MAADRGAVSARRSPRRPSRAAACRARHAALAKRIVGDSAQVSPETKCAGISVDLARSLGLRGGLRPAARFRRGPTHSTRTQRTISSTSPRAHTSAQICWFLLTEARAVPGRLLQPLHPDARVGRALIRSSTSTCRATTVSPRASNRKSGATSFLKSGIETGNAPSIHDRPNRAGRDPPKAPILLTGPTGAGKIAARPRISELKHAPPS